MPKDLENYKKRLKRIVNIINTGREYIADAVDAKAIEEVLKELERLKKED